MSRLWLPLAARKQQEARLVEMTELHDRMQDWNDQLRQIDPYLQLVRAKPDAHAPGLRPGYWHVMRHNPDGPPLLYVIEGENGEFREPDSGVFEELRRQDMWSERSQRERLRRQEALSRAHIARRNREREERNQEARERFQALESPGVSMCGSFARQKKA